MKKLHRLHIVITKKQYETIRKIAFKERKSIAQIIREIIDKTYL